MPELPDIVCYIRALEPRILDTNLEKVRLASPFVLRSVDPPVRELEAREVKEIRRIGKRIAIGVEGDLWLVIHLMIAGRLHWKQKGARVAGKAGLAAFDFSGGTLTLTEASTKKRAGIFTARGESGLAEHRRGGVEVLDSDCADFAEALTCENHTAKRALTDPRLFSGIGNAYSDEILHRAKLSPVKLTSRMTKDEICRLYAAAMEILVDWTDRLIRECGEEFPEKVTAFRPEMAVHGRYNQPCPVCGAPVQRIVYAENEANYCAVCQTDGKLLADRGLSRLLKSDWPRTLADLEEKKAGLRRLE